MAHRTPLVIEDTLTFCEAAHERSIPIESDAWFAWLGHATSFAYVAAGGRLTAQKRQRKGHWYWYAYARCDTRVRMVYLGPAHKLTRARLTAALHTLHPVAPVTSLNHETTLSLRPCAALPDTITQIPDFYRVDPSSHQRHVNLSAVHRWLHAVKDALHTTHTSAKQTLQCVLTVIQLLWDELADQRTHAAHDLAITRALLQATHEQLLRAEASHTHHRRGEVW